MTHIRAFFGCILLAAALTSCTVPAKQAEERDANGNKIEYVYYTPTGSSIPVKVPKDSLQLTDTEAASENKAVTDWQRDAQINPPPNTGSK
jgi:hypothetical protein